MLKRLQKSSMNCGSVREKKQCTVALEIECQMKRRNFWTVELTLYLISKKSVQRTFFCLTDFFLNSYFRSISIFKTSVTSLESVIYGISSIPKFTFHFQVHLCHWKQQYNCCNGNTSRSYQDNAQEWSCLHFQRTKQGIFRWGSSALPICMFFLVFHSLPGLQGALGMLVLAQVHCSNHNSCQGRRCANKQVLMQMRRMMLCTIGDKKVFFLPRNLHSVTWHLQSTANGLEMSRISHLRQKQVSFHYFNVVHG
jgi:hypothetical protein